MRFARLSVPVVLAVLLMLVLTAVALAAPANPADITSKACSFGTTWWDGISRIIEGLALIILGMGLIGGIRNLHTEGPWAPILALIGVGIFLGVIAWLPSIAPVALAAAGGPSCP